MSVRARQGQGPGVLAVVWTLQGEEDARTQGVRRGWARGRVTMPMENLAFLRTKIRGGLLKIFKAWPLFLYRVLGGRNWDPNRGRKATCTQEALLDPRV